MVILVELSESVWPGVHGSSLPGRVHADRAHLRLEVRDRVEPLRISGEME